MQVLMHCPQDVMQATQGAQQAAVQLERQSSQQLQSNLPKWQHTPQIIQTQQHRQHRITNPATPPTMYQMYVGMFESDTVEFEGDDVAGMVGVIPAVGILVSGVLVLVFEGGGVVPDIGVIHVTPAASLSKQKKMTPDGHSSKLFSLPVHSQSLTQMFPAPSPKRVAASV